jgi:hypothetical protein
MLDEEFLKFGIFKAELTPDEITVLYAGKHSGKMLMWGMSIKVVSNYGVNKFTMLKMENHKAPCTVRQTHTI